MSQDNLRVLDCTLRDGGYYNNWFFDKDLVCSYVNALSEAGVHFIELGFRNPTTQGLGPLAYTTEDYLNEIELPKGPKYGVMIDAKDFSKEGINISNFFCKKEVSKISLVRVAVNFENYKIAEPLCRDLSELGYKVGLNLMQSHCKTDDRYIEVSSDIEKWNTIEVLYFADSLGNMSHEEVSNISLMLAKGWKGELGIHTHNNKGYALNNSISAINSGITWCDGTISGMGRGAGNVPTENLLTELKHLNIYEGESFELTDIINTFNDMKGTYDWGPNLFYHFAANKNIHPTFVQTLLVDDRYNDNQILKSLNYLSNIPSTSFNEESLQESIFVNEDVSGNWSAKEWLHEQEVLLVANGPSLIDNRDKIYKFVEDKECAVLFLNYNPLLPELTATATVACNQSRILIESDLYNKLNHPLVIPFSRYKELIKDKLRGIELFDYGLNIEQGTFSIDSNKCVLDSTLVAAYSLSLVTAAGCSKIFLAGFDGFSPEDARNIAMERVFKQYCDLEISKPIEFITKSTYSVHQ